MSKPQKLYVVIRTDDDYEPRSNPVAAYLTKQDAEEHVARAQDANTGLWMALHKLQEKLGDDYYADKGDRARKRLLAKNKALLGHVNDGDNLFSVWGIPFLPEVPELKR